MNFVMDYFSSLVFSSLVLLVCLMFIFTFVLVDFSRKCFECCCDYASNLFVVDVV